MMYVERRDESTMEYALKSQKQSCFTSQQKEGTHQPNVELPKFFRLCFTVERVVVCVLTQT